MNGSCDSTVEGGHKVKQQLGIYFSNYLNHLMLSQHKPFTFL